MEVRARQLTPSPTHLLFLPPGAQPRPFQTPSSFCTVRSLSLRLSHLSGSLLHLETQTPLHLATPQRFRQSDWACSAARAASSASQARLCTGQGPARRFRPGASASTPEELRGPGRTLRINCALSRVILHLQPSEGLESLEMFLVEGLCCHLSFLCS